MDREAAEKLVGDFGEAILNRKTGIEPFMDVVKARNALIEALTAQPPPPETKGDVREYFISTDLSLHDKTMEARGYHENGIITITEVRESAPTLRNPIIVGDHIPCLLYTSPSPRDGATSRMPSSA